MTCRAGFLPFHQSIGALYRRCRLAASPIHIAKFAIGRTLLLNAEMLNMRMKVPPIAHEVIHIAGREISYTGTWNVRKIEMQSGSWYRQGLDSMSGAVAISNEL